MKKIIFSLFFLLFTSTFVYALTFSDVSEDHYYYDAVDFLVSTGVVVGNPDGSFEPDDVLNRAEALTMVAKAVYQYKELDDGVFDEYASEACFSDVLADLWYTEYVCYAFAEGWIVGYSDGDFRPGDDVKFVEALKIVYKGFGFNYDGDDSIWYKPIVDDAASFNYIPLTISAFDQALTRAEIADLLARVIKFEEGDLDDY